jgi:hypothetical protein
MSKLTVAVTVVTYKSAELTVRCLESLLVERQHAKFDIRVFVVDNASGDYPTLERVIHERSWTAWVSLTLAPRNGGFGYGNNLAISQAMQQCNPKYIYLLNPDTEARVGVTTALVDFLDDHPQVGIAGSSFENLDGSDWPIAFRFPTMRSEMCQCLDIGIVSRLFRDSLVPRVMPKTAQPTDWVSGASMMVRSEVFAAVGGFDENYFLYFEETDFSYRAKLAGYSTWYVPQGIVMHVSGYSTHVTSQDSERRRLPGYWFESRRRYFVLTQGLTAAKLIDIVALASSAIGLIKRSLMGQRRRIVPYFIRDLWRYSILRRRNQVVPIAATRLNFTR